MVRGSNRYSTADKSGFTINVGVISALLLDFLRGVHFFPGKQPSITDRVVRTRLRALTDQADDWLELTVKNVESLPLEVAQQTALHALPWVDAHIRDNDLLAAWLALFNEDHVALGLPRTPYPAILLTHANRLAERESVLDFLIKRWPSSDYKLFAKNLQTHGLSVKPTSLACC